jgi:hypothetical protein
MISSLVMHVGKLKFLAVENAPTLLTGVGVVGTVSTAVLTGRSTVRAVRKVETKSLEKQMENLEEADSTTPIPLDSDWQLSKKDVFKLCWPLYIPPTICGITTIMAIVTANRIDARKIAALTAAAGISERAFQEYKDKVVEKLGPNQDRKIRDEVAQDQITKEGGPRELVIVNEGKVLCKDMMSGRYFECTNEDLKRAENWVNHELLHHNDCSLSEFYGQIGMDATSYSDSVGWNAANSVELQITTAMTPDNRPCLAVDCNDYDVAEEL